MKIYMRAPDVIDTARVKDNVIMQSTSDPNVFAIKSANKFVLLSATTGSLVVCESSVLDDEYVVYNGQLVLSNS